MREKKKTKKEMSGREDEKVKGNGGGCGHRIKGKRGNGRRDKLCDRPIGVLEGNEQEKRRAEG